MRERKKKKNNVKKRSYWILWVTILSFILSALLIFISASALEHVSLITAFIILLIIILVGITFDTIGISVASANAATFHSMAAKKMAGAKNAVWLVENADKVSSFCNDVIGDICGVISGAASALIIISVLGNMENIATSWPNLVISGGVAAMTVGGKAIGKKIAVKNGTTIVYKVGAILHFFANRKDK